MPTIILSYRRDDTGPIAPPRVRSVTQEKAIRTKPNVRGSGPQ